MILSFETKLKEKTMDNFIYDTPTRVYFGKGQEEKVGEIIKEYNPKKVLVHFGGGSAV